MVATDGRPAPNGEAPAFNLSTYLNQRQTQVEAALDRSLPLTYPEKIYEAMRYSLLAGGKRLRPILCLATCELVGGTVEMAMPTACALEMVHTMSLIHDDLPAMDNDDYRRGKLTNHKVYGEDIAILAGDGLLAYAFEYIAAQTQNVPAGRVLQVIARLAIEYIAAQTQNVPAGRVLQVIARLGRAVGASGLVGGQVVDLESEGKSNIQEETLNFIHTHKTGALLEACVVCGGILAGATDADQERLSSYAKNIGLAFQIVDDILDITATQEELGKTAGKDLQAQKATYPSLWGLEVSKAKAQQLVNAAKAELDVFGEKAQALIAIANFITTRTH